MPQGDSCSQIVLLMEHSVLTCPTAVAWWHMPLHAGNIRKLLTTKASLGTVWTSLLKAQAASCSLEFLLLLVFATACRADEAPKQPREETDHVASSSISADLEAGECLIWMKQCLTQLVSGSC